MAVLSPEIMGIFTFGGILFISLIVSDISRRIGQSEVIGLVLIGIILGPYMLGILEPTEFLKFLGELGLLLLLFIAGLETNIKEVSKMGPAPIILAIGGVVFIFLIIMPFVYFLTNDILLSFFLASAATATSVGITMKVFHDYGKSSSMESQMIIIAAIVDDILALFLLIFASELVIEQQLTIVRFFELLWSLAGYFLTMIGFSVLISSYLMRFVLKLKARGSILLFALSFAILSAYSAATVGLSPVVGAYIAGVILSETHTRDEVMRSVSTIALVTVPIFFLNTGMNINVGVLYDAFIIGLIFTILAVIGKVLGGLMTNFLSNPKIERQQSLLLGFGMVPRGEIGLIFAGIGISMGILNQYWYSALVMMVLLTTFIAPLAIRVFLSGGEDQSGQRT